MFYGSSVFYTDPGIYDCIKFISSSQIDIEIVGGDVASLPNDFFNNPNSAVRTVSNGHVVYTITNPNGLNGSIVITVVDENTITFIATDNTTGQTHTGRLTKYVG